ncbi:MAG: YabP/YqfC family sporulation protein [Clostridia bacterium]|nr:YabP/YqfC family sporulation protein [Clostridia bacterium]
MKNHPDKKDLAKMKKRIFEPRDDGKLADAFKIFEIPEESIFDLSHIELISNEKAILDNIDGIMEYEETIIKISKGDFIIAIYGENLGFSSLKTNSVVITGRISRLEFER